MDVLFGIIGVILDVLALTPLARTFWTLFAVAAAILAGAWLLGRA